MQRKCHWICVTAVEKGWKKAISYRKTISFYYGQTIDKQTGKVMCAVIVRTKENYWLFLSFRHYLWRQSSCIDLNPRDITLHNRYNTLCSIICKNVYICIQTILWSCTVSLIHFICISHGRMDKSCMALLPSKLWFLQWEIDFVTL